MKRILLLSGLFLGVLALTAPVDLAQGGSRGGVSGGGKGGGGGGGGRGAGGNAGSGGAGAGGAQPTSPGGVRRLPPPPTRVIYTGPVTLNAAPENFLLKPRSLSSLEVLRIAWDYPVHTPPGLEPGQSYAPSALVLEEALAGIAGLDRRPLLAMRECSEECQHEGVPFLKPGDDNEKTLLLARWFHCVKLPPEVQRDDHPFHAVFAMEEPPHFFLARWNGEERVDFLAKHSRGELQAAMQALITSEYKKSSKRALKDLGKALDALDVLDLEISELTKELDRVSMESGPKSSKAQRVRRDLDDSKADRAKEREKIVKLSDLGLRHPTPAAAEPLPAEAQAVEATAKASR